MMTMMMIIPCSKLDIFLKFVLNTNQTFSRRVSFCTLCPCKLCQVNLDTEKGHFQVLCMLPQTSTISIAPFLAQWQAEIDIHNFICAHHSYLSMGLHIILCNAHDLQGQRNHRNTKLWCNTGHVIASLAEGQQSFKQQCFSAVYQRSKALAKKVLQMSFGLQTQLRYQEMIVYYLRDQESRR